MAKAKGKTTNFLVWIILGLLIIGLAGFGVDGFGGSAHSIGRVGDREIRAQDYFRALQQEIRAAEAELGNSLSFSEVQSMGIDANARARLVTIAALENEADRLGVSVGDDAVREEILSIQAFQGLDGSFSRESYRFALQQQGMSESDFEDQLRRDAARGILQSAVISGLPAPERFTDTLHDYIGERRSLSFIRLDRSALDAPIPASDDAELRAYYEDNIDDYTRPEARRISYAWITPSMIIDTVEVDETALRELYESRLSEFVRPERRLVERLIFSSAADAQAALERIESGDAGFGDIVSERGLGLEDVDLGDVTREELDEAAAEAVFGLEGPGVVGPFDTDFGPALYRMNAILAPQETPFEDAVEDLRPELARDRARRIIADQYDAYEDLLAGGATLEDMARETEMEFGQIDYRPETSSGIAAYEAFRAEAERASEDDFPEIHTLEDGGVFALRLDQIVPPTPTPFDDVVIQVIEDWETAETERRLADQAEDIVTALERGESAADLGRVADRLEEITRSEFLDGIPQAVVSAAFELEEGARTVVPAEGDVFVVTLESVMPPETDTPEAQQLRGSINEQTRQAMAQDLFSFYAVRLEAEAGIELDSAAIQAVHQQFR